MVRDNSQGPPDDAPEPQAQDSVATAGSPDPPPGSDAPEAPPVPGEGYRVHLAEFEGPLDLLLHLIKEDEVDITDIPIARITEQYLESIQAVDVELDLDRAGEYLLMAATLMRIKAKMLIPRDEDDEDDEDGVDPRAELVRRLLEYREFKRVAETLGEREDEWRGAFRRLAVPVPEVENSDGGELDVSLMELFRAFQGVLQEMEGEGPLEMETEEYAVDEQMDFIRLECGRLEEGVPFSRLFRERRSRNLLITTFLALLELVREREIVVQQVDRFGEIWLRKPAEQVDER